MAATLARIRRFYLIETGHVLNPTRYDTISEAASSINPQTTKPVRIHLPNGMRVDPRLFSIED